MTARGRIIKRDQLDATPPSRFNPDDTLRRIEEQIASANQQLAKERTEATTEVQKIYDKANQDGYQAGYDKGLRQGLAEQEAAYAQKLTEEVHSRISTALESLNQLIEQLKSQPAEWVKSWEPEATDLITAIAGRVARRVVAADSQVIVRTLREILGMVARAPKITIKAHPIDLETLKLNHAEWQNITATGSEIEFVADPSLTRGGCRITTESCAIDASVETQIQRLLNEIAGEVSPPPTS